MPSDSQPTFRLPLSDVVAPVRVTIPLAPPPDTESEPEPEPDVDSAPPAEPDSAPPPEPEAEPEADAEPRQFDLAELLDHATTRGAWAIHLGVAARPLVRTARGLEPVVGHSVLGPDDVRRILGYLLADRDWQQIDRGQSLDVVCEVPSTARIRVSVLPALGGLSAVLRLLPWQVPTLAELGLPGALADVTRDRAGLVLVGGSPAATRASVLAALLDAVVEQGGRAAVTIEGPVAFVHVNGTGVVSQRDVGAGSDARRVALREARGHDPDVVLVDDLDDPAVVASALDLAEAGTLVLAGVGAPHATAALERIVMGTAPDQRALLRDRLAASVLAAVCVRTVAPREGDRPVIATEVLVMTADLRRRVVAGEFAAVPAVLAAGAAVGMHTIDQDLARLVRAGSVAAVEARRHCGDPGELDRLVNP